MPNVKALNFLKYGLLLCVLCQSDIHYLVFAGPPDESVVLVLLAQPLHVFFVVVKDIAGSITGMECLYIQLMEVMPMTYTDVCFLQLFICSRPVLGDCGPFSTIVGTLGVILFHMLFEAPRFLPHKQAGCFGLGGHEVENLVTEIIDFISLKLTTLFCQYLLLLGLISHLLFSFPLPRLLYLHKLHDVAMLIFAPPQESLEGVGLDDMMLFPCQQVPVIESYMIIIEDIKKAREQFLTVDEPIIYFNLQRYESIAVMLTYLLPLLVIEAFVKGLPDHNILRYGLLLGLLVGF